MDDMIKKGRKRIYRIEIRLNEIENSKLTFDSLSSGLSKAELIRSLIIHNKIKQKPDMKFYKVMDNLTKIYMRLTQLVETSRGNNNLDIEELKEQQKNWKEIIKEIEEKFL